MCRVFLTAFGREQQENQVREKGISEKRKQMKRQNVCFVVAKTPRKLQVILKVIKLA